MGHQPRAVSLRLLLLSLFAILVVLAPVIEIAGHGSESGVAFAKPGNGNGHGKAKDRGEKGNKGKGNDTHGENGKHKGKGKKKGHHKDDEVQVTAVLLSQTEVTPTPSLAPLRPEPSTTTGMILVIAYICPSGADPETVDWYLTCTTVLPDVTFRLVRNGLPDDPAQTGTTDEHGELTFEDLDPGTYHLTEDGGDWCHAESDSVNANGDVIVRANEQATVWIFHCPQVE